MTLEDHVGDIVRKARGAARRTTEEVASALGLPRGEYEVWEKSGQTSKPINLAAAAECVGLHPGRLKQIAEGWLPQVPDLSQWRELRSITTEQEGYAVNAFVVWDEVSREAALFDTGWEAVPVIALAEENSLEMKHLFLTHHHEDHVAGLEAIKRKWPKIRLHTSSRQASPEHRNRPQDFVHLGNLRITPRETPGHSDDGVTYIIGGFPEDAPLVAIVGDALFAGSMGCGFVSPDQLKKSIREQIFNLPASTLLCPGHGPLTTLAQELTHNPFFS